MGATGSVDLVVWSDYLCPWCHLGTRRVRRLEDEFGDAVRIEWRAFLLRPVPEEGRTLERFRAYTRSWLRPAAELDAPELRTWTSDEGPPSHSIPAHVVAKAAAALGRDAFRAMHDRLLRAYFVESRDITSTDALRVLWREVGLDEGAFAMSADPAMIAAVVAEHRDALAHGVNGVPAIMMVGNDVPVVGAMPFESYRRWIARALDRSGPA